MAQLNELLMRKRVHLELKKPLKQVRITEQLDSQLKVLI